MRKDDKALSWVIEVAVVLAIVFLLIGACFFAVPRIQKINHSAPPALTVFNVEDVQSEKGSVPPSGSEMIGSMDDVILSGSGVVTELDESSLVACIRVTSDSYRLGQGEEYRFDFTNRIDQDKLTFEGIKVGDAVEFGYWNSSYGGENGRIGEYIKLASASASATSAAA